MDDRTRIAPPHEGPLVLPCCSLFNRLLRFAYDQPPKIAVRDAISGQEASYLQLLTDVLACRTRLIATIGEDVQARIEAGDEVYIAVLAAGGYEYVVGMLAVLATGAAAVPLTIALPPKEALYYASKSRSIAVMASSAALHNGLELGKLVKQADPHSKFVCMSIGPSTFSQLSSTDRILVSAGKYLDENAPGVVIFTSGTTGPPKGSVMRRAYTFDGALAVADHYNLTSSDVLLHLLPVHHATGVGIMFFPFLISGALIEFKSGGFDPEWTWDRWRQRGLTFFSGVPTIYMRMMRYYEQHLAHRSDVADFVNGARNLRACLCGTSALPKPIADFWTQILGKKILLRYGATEFGAVFKVRVGDDHVPDGSVGQMVAGVDIKLSDGDEGEVLIKSPYMFSKYMYDPEATRRAHDDQGFYKSGDIARQEGDYYWIMGRASVDIIKSGGYKLSSLDIEREILGLPYTSEVTVVGVEDEEFGQRVAAAIVLREASSSTTSSHNGADHKVPPVTIDRLREDLSGRLARYKMPTLLRIVQGELPKSQTGKISKKTLGPQLFPPDYEKLREVQVWSPRQGRHTPKPRL